MTIRGSTTVEDIDGRFTWAGEVLKRDNPLRVYLVAYSPRFAPSAPIHIATMKLEYD